MAENFYFFIGLTENKIFFPPLVGGWEEKWELKLTSAKVVVEVEAEIGKKYQDCSQKY